MAFFAPRQTLYFPTVSMSLEACRAGISRHGKGCNMIVILLSYFGLSGALGSSGKANAFMRK